MREKRNVAPFFSVQKYQQTSDSGRRVIVTNIHYAAKQKSQEPMVVPLSSTKSVDICLLCGDIIRKTYQEL
jgi:hypothetical protein